MQLIKLCKANSKIKLIQINLKLFSKTNLFLQYIGERLNAVSCERVRSDLSERNLFASFRKFTAHSHVTSTKIPRKLKISDGDRKFHWNSKQILWICVLLKILKIFKVSTCRRHFEFFHYLKLKMMRGVSFYA